MDGFGTDFELEGERGGGGMGAGLDRLMDTQHALQGRAGMQHVVLGLGDRLHNLVVRY